MSITIDSLDIQIKSSAGSAAANIERLADSLGKLRESSKLTTVSNNLNKLASALDKLEGSSLGISKVEALGRALKSLTQLGKMSGVTSALNSLSKIPEVVNKLDGATLESFGKKIREVTAALAPLATQLNNIGNGFSKLPARISQVTSGTKKMAKASREAADAQEEHGTALNAFQINLAATLSNIQTFVQGLQAIKETMASVLNEAISWDGIQFRFGQAFAEDANEVYDWVLKINEALGISVQEFMQYSGIYASLLKGFGLEQSKLTEISVGLTELTYDIWAFSNDRYKNLEDAAEAVRSAITGEIEPIRNAGIALTEASMQEYLDSIGQAHVSIEKLTEAQKAEVRYAVMVKSAMQQGIVGTYAREMDTAEGAVRRLSQQMKTLTQSFGSLFIPILQVAIPWITAFVDILTDAVHWVAALFGVEIGKIDWSKTTTGVDSLAEGAQNANSALDSASDAAKKLKSYTMGFDELNVINPSSDSAGGAGGAGGADGNGFQSLDLESIWDEALLDSASKKVDEIKAKILEWKTPILVALGLLGTAGLIGTLGTVISKIVDITNLWRAFGGAITGSNAAASALAFLSPKWSNVATVITGATKAVAAFVGGLTIGPILAIAGIIAAIVSVVVFLKNNWEEVTAAVKGFFETNIVPKLESIKESFNKMKAALPEGVVLWLENVIQKVKEFFESGKLLDGIGKAFEVVGGVIFSVAGGAIATGFSTIVQLIQGVIKWFSGVIQYISGFAEFWVALFSGGDLIEPLKKMWGGIKDIFTGMYDMTIGVVVNWVKSIIDWFTNLWDELVGHSIVPDMIKAIIEWFLSLPKKILDPIKNFCNDIKEKFQKLWSDVKSWWNTNVAPKFTKDYWKNKFNVIKEAITSKLDEAKQTISEKWKAITGWFGSNVAPKFTLDYWKNKFDVIKQGITAKLEEVKNAISTKWTAIKGWFTQNVAPKFTLSFWLDKFKNLKTGFTQTIKNAVNAGIDLMNKFIGWINEKLNFSWDAVKVAGKEIVPGGSIQLFTIPKIPRLETGGFLEDGLFTMNHGEIAGKFNNGKSVVANNQQIVEGIAAGVYQAVVSAMSATNGNQSQSINVYLDGKQIAASVRKTESERGRSLMGNQLGYAY